jgi:glycosyltransferase involved in cell wall biosynthesis
MKKKRVVLLRSNPVSPDPPVEKTADFLLSEGYDVTILAWDRSTDKPVEEDLITLAHGQAKVYRAFYKGQFSGGIKKNLKSLIRFQKFLYTWLKRNKENYDIIHAYDFDTALVASLIAKKYKKKFVYAILDYYVASHNLSGSTIGNVIKKLEDKTIGEADVTLICTEKRKEQIKGATPKYLEIIHNTPIEPKLCDIVERVCKSDSNRMKIVYVGIFGEGRLLRELSHAVKNRADCELHIGGFGAGMEAYFEELSHTTDNIFYYGKLKYRDTLQLERECDVMTAIYDPVVPNHQFAAPNKFYESLMLGKPIIMVENTGFDDIIRNEHIGELIHYNEESLNSAISELLNKRNEWNSMSTNAKRLYKDFYSWEIMQGRLKKVYALFD